jgi:hypothetical protein
LDQLYVNRTLLVSSRADCYSVPAVALYYISIVIKPTSAWRIVR